MKYLVRLAIPLTLVGILMLPSAASAGRAWCRADPVLMLDGDVVDIQVSSSLEMYAAASGPIEMIVRVPAGTQANVLLEDFGFGHGYDISIEETNNLPAGVRARVLLNAPADDSALPVGVHGLRLDTNIVGLLFGTPDLLWADSASGNANEWIVLDVR